MACARHPLLDLFPIAVTGLPARGLAAEPGDPVLVVVASAAVRRAVSDELGATAQVDVQRRAAASDLVLGGVRVRVN